ncbi:MAG: SPASM domain-containing protein [Actinophytocola sp.]|uniref:radical SAM/SPASM domain-containing protein n=1 Tax=Actinophytocola sp. TaxID=1872138 RepID=UPI00132518EC|nr:radical SAM protein [Actinophytocola sp.]MPZ82224.1 SPASM domain-containing protein [Actinophytocola sp.]
MRLSLTAETRVGLADELRFEDRGSHTLVVSPGTGGWMVTDDQSEVDVLRALETGTLDDIDLQPERVAELFQHGLVTLDDMGYGTSSSRVEGLRLLAPTSTHNTYPVLGIFHVHNWCNLACTYCYTIEDGVPRKQLKLELMLKAVDELVALPTPLTSLEFHGGEPTMALKDIRQVVAYAKEVYAKANKKVVFSIQTNGYNLSPAVCDFLADNNFSVRVSLDGTQEMHDEFRVDHRGKGSYKGVVKGIKRLQDKGVAVHAVCVVHAGNTDRIVEMYDSMAALDVASVQSGNAGDEDWLSGDRYFESYFKVVKHVAARARAGEELVPLVNLLAGELGSLRSFRREYMCMRNPCGAGVNMITVDTNGDLYPCEEMVGKPEFVIGNLAETDIRTAIDTSPVVEKLRERHVEEIDECNSCTWKQFCHGGCVHKSYTHFKRLDRESEHCSYYKRIYQELIWLDVEEPGTWELLSPTGR